MIQIKTINRNNEPFTFNDVKEYGAESGGVLRFTDSEGTRHVTNEEFHVTEKP